MSTKPYLHSITLNIGSDPEFFFAKAKTVKGKQKLVVIGAEKILPEEGITKKSYWQGRNSKITIDGVQAEINPAYDTCRARHTNEMKSIFQRIQKELKKHKDITIDWSPTVRVTRAEMNSLKDSNKEFGCDPSYSAYGEQMQFPDPYKHLYRWAGGHIHLGSTYPGNAIDKLLRQPEKVIPIMDILVGNTCVLIDRDPGNKNRRKTYGRAGEYRTPPHGLEYRTLSNFWLRSNQLMSFVYGMSRLAVSIAANEEISKMVLKAVKIDDIRKAINENDFELAQKNFNKIRSIIEDYAPHGDTLCKDNLAAFDYFVKKGSKFYFRQDPLKHWTTVKEGHADVGWETFLQNKVTPQMLKK